MITYFKPEKELRVLLKRIFGISVILGTFFSTLYASQSVTLNFSDSSIVNDAVIKLGDIAQISGQSEVLQNSDLLRTAVGDAAPAGYVRYMNVYDIIHYMLKPLHKEIVFHANGAERVKIRTDAKIRRVSDYEDQILEYLHDNICWQRDNYSVSIQNSDRQWRFYRKPSIVAVKGLAGPYPKGNTSLKLRITQGTNEFTIPVMCRVKVQTPVVVAAGNISRNQIIQENDLQILLMDITGYRYAPITEYSSIIGKIAVKTLSRGTILHKKCVKAVPEICKGDNVLIIMKKGPIEVSVPARAREEGTIGERIWVENLKTHKLIRVKIYKKGIVHTNEGEAI